MATSTAANTTDETNCANCSKAESDECKLKRCTACKTVRYCSRDCQVAHRPMHKKACKKRAAELFDKELFKDPPEREECPICLIPLPYNEDGLVFHACCGKVVCFGCVHANMKETIRSGNYSESKCPFCRTPASNTDKGMIDKLHKGVERDDAASMKEMAMEYKHGTTGIKKDLAKAIELFLKAGKLGCADAYAQLGNMYRDGNGVEENPRKAKHYYELGAIGGSLNARHNLGCLEYKIFGNDERSYKHFLICAKAGLETSMESVKKGYAVGDVTKDEYAEALRAYQKQHDETKSAMRDEALVYKTNRSLYFENLKDLLS